MKSLKYAFFILFLCCFLTAAMAAAEVYTLEAKFIGVNEGSVPELTIELLEDAREVDIEIAENCRFFATTWSSGQRTAQITFDEFAKRFGPYDPVRFRGA